MSLAPHLNPSDHTVRTYLDDAATNRGNDAHLIDPTTGVCITYGESRDHVRSIANAISGLGLKAGDPVAYAFSNSTESALTILGILYGGYLATAVNLVAGESAIEYVLEHSEAKLVITDSDTKPMVEKLVSKLPNPPRLSDIHQIRALESIEDASPFLAPGDDALLMYTSGTTGKPKGVVHTQHSLLAGGHNTAHAHELSQHDRGLCVLPFYHINAFCVSLMGSLVSGSSLVVPAKFSVSSFWDMIRDNECSWFSVVPTQISYLLHNSDKPGGSSSGCKALRFGRSASAPLSPEIHEAFQKRFGVTIIETMGLTETAAQILSNPLQKGAQKLGSPGVAFGNDVMIADEALQEVERGREGEILVRGPNVLRCYLKNSEATTAAVTENGWLRTGDLGRMDEDGYVFVTGRLKELIIKGGENIAPREVDEALYLHPDVIEAAAFAVNCPDFGQRVEACVKVSDGSQATSEELLSLCQQKLGAFKSPDKVHFLSDLPKGPSGKIQRIKLAETFKCLGEGPEPERFC